MSPCSLAAGSRSRATRLRLRLRRRVRQPSPRRRPSRRRSLRRRHRRLGHPGAVRRRSGPGRRGEDQQRARDEVLTKGTGDAHPKAYDQVKAHYTAGRPTADVRLVGQARRADDVGLSQVIGLDRGLQLMVVGEKRRLWIPERSRTRARRSSRGHARVRRRAARDHPGEAPIPPPPTWQRRRRTRRRLLRASRTADLEGQTRDRPKNSTASRALHRLDDDGKCSIRRSSAARRPCSA